jgi:UDP:flavonoid glycosyltransferase YjiC (YdhE family)/nitroreductase
VSVARVLFVAEAVTLAHVGRALALARLLDRARFEPLFAWHPRFNHLLGALPGDYYPIHSVSAEFFLERLRAGRPLYDARTIEIYAAWELEIFREARPDVVVGDFRLSLLTSAAVTRLPYVNVVNAHWSPFARPRFRVPETPLARRVPVPLAQAALDLVRPWAFRAHARDFNRLSQKFGGPHYGGDLRAIYCAGDRTLYPDIPEITPTRDLPPSHRYLGPVVWSPTVPTPPILHDLPRDKPVVYVALGSSGNERLLPMILKALATLPVRVLAATGGKIRLEPAGPDQHLVDFLPGDATCAAADVLVCNGGVASAQQALVAGIPVVGIASNMDQFLYMEFVEKSGTGVLLRSDRLTPAAVAGAVREALSNRARRDRARALADVAGRYRPADLLNETVDELARRGGARSSVSPAPPPVPSAAEALPLESPEIVQELVRAALLAPSSANCQPWRFAWDGDVLEIFIDPMRSNPFFDFVNVDTWIALGGVLANMEAAAARRGLGLWVETFPEDARNGLWARVRATPRPGTSGPLADMIPARVTNRRAYRRAPVPSDARRELERWVESPGLRLDWIDTPAGVAAAARAHGLFHRLLFENPGIWLSIAPWIRRTEDEEYSRRDGMGLRSLELGRAVRWIFRRLLGPGGRVLARLLGAARWAEAGARRVGAAGGIYGLITAEAMAPGPFLEAGRAFQRLWLAATARGLSVQPLAGVLLLDYRRRFADGGGFSARERAVVDGAAASLTRAAPDFAARVPVMFFRLGYADPPSARALRLPLESVFLDKRGKLGTFLPAASPARRVTPALPGPAPRQRPRRVLFMAEAVTVTHVGRLFKLAAGLDRSRFTPLFAWDPRYNDLLGPLRDAFYPLRTVSTNDFRQRLYRGAPVYDFALLERYVSWDLEIFRESRPDVVVGDYRLSLGTSAQFAGIPYVNIINAHWSPYARPRFRVPEGPVTHRFGVRAAQFVFDALRPMFFLRFAHDFNRLNAKFGRPGFGHSLQEIYCHGDMTLYPDFPSVVPVEWLPVSHRYLGPVVWSPDLPFPEELARPAPGKRTVYVNLGTSGNETLLPAVLAALARRPTRVILATAGAAPPVNPDPSRLEMHVLAFAPGDRACAAADLVVFNGGSAGGQQALLAGKPVLGLPSNLDQFLNMHFIEAAGLGRLFRPEGATPDRLAAVLDEMCEDTALIQRVRAFAARGNPIDPDRVLAEAVESVLAGRPTASDPPRRPAGSVALDATPLDPALGRALVEAAVRAPSVGNSQPWRYSWDGTALGVHVQPDRANPFLNYTNPDTWVGLGCALANMEVAAAARGFRTEVDMPEDARGALVARVRPVPGPRTDPSLEAVLAARVTNRLAYDERPLSGAHRDALFAAVSTFEPQVRMEWVDAPASRNVVADAMAVYNRVLFENDGLLTSFLTWLRRTPAEAEATRDGLSLESLELGRLGGALFSLAASTWRAPLLAWTGLFTLFQKGSAARSRKSGAFGMLSIPLNDVESLVTAGRALEILWLKATQRGLAFQPLAGPLLLMSRMRFSGGAGLTPRQQRLAHRMMADLGRVFPFFDTRCPAIFFRIGHAPAPTARSLRHSVESLFTDLTTK